MKSLKDLLPEGLTESTVQEIMTLLTDSVSEQVKQKTDELTAKVHAFLRLQIDEIKAQAQKELLEENETFRNAKMFEGIKSLVSLEYGIADKNNNVSQLNTEKAELLEEVNYLTQKLAEALKYTSSLEAEINEEREEKQKITLVSSKLQRQKEALSKERKLLEEQVQNFKKSDVSIIKSSERAKVVSRADAKSHGSNPYLTEDIINLSRE